MEITSVRLARIAGKGLKNPYSLSAQQIRELCGCVLTQREYDVVEDKIPRARFKEEVPKKRGRPRKNKD